MPLNFDLGYIPGSHADPWLVCEAQFARAAAGHRTGCPDAETRVLAAAAPSIVEHILISAAKSTVSDVHFELRDRMVVRIRKDGALRPIFAAPKLLGQFMVGRLKALAELPLCPGKHPEGSFSLRRDSTTHALRLSLVTMADGEKAVVRFLDTGTGLELRRLGVSEQDLSRYDNLIRDRKSTRLNSSHRV